MINDFNNGTVGWTDWNILLDEMGGPNHVKNFCFAPVHADTKTGQLIYTNSYFYIGHFSKFVRPGAKRIACSSSRSQLLSTAFVRSEEHTSELQSHLNLVCRLLLEKKKKTSHIPCV